MEGGRREGLAVDKGKPGSREPFIKEPDSKASGAGGLVKSGWRIIREELERASEKSAVHVDMNGSVEVPGDIFDTIRGRDVTVAFDLGDGIIWKVNGREVVTDRARDMDFFVETGGSRIPADRVRQTAGEQDSVQLHLAHSGELGFTAVLCLNVGREYAGRSASLYYYQEDKGELAFMCMGEIDGEGIAELVFTHASDYLVVIGEPGTDGSEASRDSGKAGMGEAPLTRALPWMLPVLALIVILIYILLFRARKRGQ